MKKQDIGYENVPQRTIYNERLCRLTIGSIIIFNGRKSLVTHTESHSRNYKLHNGKTIDITLSVGGFLKDIETGKETRSNWERVTADRILHFENLDLV